MNFEQASSLGRRMRQASGGEPQYLIEWCGDWCVSNYRPRGGLRCVVVEIDDFGPRQQEREQSAAILP